MRVYINGREMASGGNAITTDYGSSENQGPRHGLREPVFNTSVMTIERQLLPIGPR